MSASRALLALLITLALIVVAAFLTSCGRNEQVERVDDNEQAERLETMSSTRVEHKKLSVYEYRASNGALCVIVATRRGVAMWCASQ